MKNREIPLGIRKFKGSSLIKKTDGLTRIKRGRKVLFIEKETASWMILEQAKLALFESLNSPKTVDEILSGPITALSVEEKEELLFQLYNNNLISFNGIHYFEPKKLWVSPTKYPQFLCLHITSACNFVCKYCYARANPHLEKMPLEVAYKVMERILEEIPHEYFLIDFHGGEPFLAYDEMVKTIKYAQEYNKKRGLNKRLDFIVQSNGSLVTVEKAKTLESLNCSIGFSLDGPEFVQNSQRIYPDGSGTFSQVWKNMQDLKEAGAKLGFIAVIHKPENYKHAFKFFTDYGLTGFRLNYSAYIGRATEELEFPHGRGEEFARHWLEMVDIASEYVLEKGHSLSIKDLDQQINNITSKGRPFMCYRSPCGCGRSILGFGYNGGIYACEEGTGIDAFKIGSIYDTSKTIPEIIDTSEVLEHITGRTVDNIPKCKECTFKRFCGGRCTTKSYARYGNFRREDAMCRFYQIVYPELIWRIHDRPELIPLLNPPEQGFCRQKDCKPDEKSECTTC
ncbi:MAG: radical SAM protein [Firmicutes bacterium]|nr:radical SAM protein [Bacillota bacterium]